MRIAIALCLGIGGLGLVTAMTGPAVAEVDVSDEYRWTMANGAVENRKRKNPVTLSGRALRSTYFDSAKPRRRNRLRSAQPRTGTRGFKPMVLSGAIEGDL